MKICLGKLSWYNRENIWVTGFIREKDRYLKNDDLINYFAGTDSILKFEQALKKANGQFSVIIKSDNEIKAATDRLRNYPLYYSSIDGEFTISDDCYKLAGMQKVEQFDPISYNCFLTTGFVLNNLTLADNVYQIEAGEYVISGDRFYRKFYFDATSDVINEKDLKTASNELIEIITDVLKNHFTALNDNFIAIALSGGFDSRLVAAMCSRFHPDNTICFTYGIRNNAETLRAEKIAKRLGFKWINIEYHDGLVEGFLQDKTFRSYYPYVSDLTSMFFMQEYFAVKYLKENKIVPDNCVFLNGFSGDMLAGGHLVPDLKKRLGRGKIAELIFKKFSGIVKLKSGLQADIIKMIDQKMQDNDFKAWTVFENWDQKERQAKFIVNSAKVFSFFGYDYVLPLWDKQFIDFFSALPVSLKINKKLYDYVLTEYIFKEFNLNLADEINPLPSQKAIQRIKERIKYLLPHGVIELFIKHQSPILYDEITKAMIQDIGSENIIDPVQSNFYNSYITQWYLYKTKELFSGS